MDIKDGTFDAQAEVDRIRFRRAEARRKLFRNSRLDKYRFEFGLRAHELLTLRPANERPASAHREWSSDRFPGSHASSISSPMSRNNIFSIPATVSFKSIFTCHN